MKKRLLAMLLALVMVMGALPMAAFADGEPTPAASGTKAEDIIENNAVAELSGEKVGLANHPLPGDAPWDSASVEITGVTGGDTSPKVISVTLSVKNLEEHNNAQSKPGKWIGIAVPAEESDDKTTSSPAYFTGLGNYTDSGYANNVYTDNNVNPAVNGYVATGYLNSHKITKDGTTYVCRYWDIKDMDGTKGFVVKKTMSGDVASYIIYDVTFAITNETTAYADEGKVVAANLTAGDKGPAPAFGQAAAYDVDYNATNHTITIYATALQQTTNPDNNTKYWVGVGLPKADSNTKYNWGFDKNSAPETFTAHPSQPTRTQTVGEQEYSTLYWYSTNWTEEGKSGWVQVKEGHKAHVTYTVDFKITPEGTPFAQTGDVKAANLTAVDGETAPAFGHATDYSATYNTTDKTITIAATDLQKTTNTEDTEAYWVGVALKVAADDKVVKGFGTLPSAKELNAKLADADTLTTQQETGYYTTYWGWRTAEGVAANQGGWLAVQHSDKSVNVYKVIFNLTTKTETTTNPTTPELPPVSSSTSSSGDTTTTTTTNPDGSTTTTVTDKKTGTVTETTEKEDGTVEVKETLKDGTVTETTTNPDGSTEVVKTEPDGTVTETSIDAEGAKVEKVTTPEEDVTITVTDAEGEELAKVSIPAEIPEPETRFEDVPEDHWANEAIHNMAALAVVEGVGGNQFDMDGSMTRGALATVLSRLSDGKKGLTTSFADVDANQWYADGIAWAAKTGVVTGYSATEFGPTDPITREQLAVMLCRYARLLGMDTAADTASLDGFTDGANAHDWGADSIAWCVEKGIINGMGDGTVAPTATATRAQVVVMLQRFINLMK